MSGTFVEIKGEDTLHPIEEMSQYPLSKHYGNMKVFGRGADGGPKYMLGPHCNYLSTQIRSS
jgi:hypothetical protein